MAPGARSHLARYGPHVFIATFFVALFPLLAVFALESSGIITSALVATGVGIALSMSIARLGAWAWVRHSGSRDLVFGDLMLWGWLKRMRTESRLTNSVELLGLDRSGTKVKDVEISAARQTEILRGLATALETGDPFTHGHTKRVTRYSYMLAKTMRLPHETVRKIRAAAAVHDVGKIETPSEILNKPGALTDEEFEIMKRHSAVGAKMVEQLGDPEITAMVRHHHERMDGTGYPDNLSGGMIPLGARVIAVADTFDAIISSRPYRGARRHKDAIEILERVAGTQLDERAVYAFLSYYSGRKPLAWWLSFSAGVQRVLGGMGGWLQHAQGASQGAFSLAMAVGLATASIAIPGVADFGRKKAGSPKALVAVERAADHTYVSDLVGGYDIVPGPGAASAGLASVTTGPVRDGADHILAAAGSGGALVGDLASVPVATDEVVAAPPSDVETPVSTPPVSTPAPKDKKTPPGNPCDDMAARARDEEDDDCDVDEDDTDGGGGDGTDGTDGDNSDGTDGKEGDDSDTNVTGPTDGTDGDNSQATDPIEGDDSDPTDGPTVPTDGATVPNDGGTAPTDGGVDQTDLTDGDDSDGTDGSANDDSDTNVTGDTDGTDGDNSNGTDPLDGDDSDPTDGPDNTNNGEEGNHGEGNNGEEGNHGEGNDGNNEEAPGQLDDVPLPEPVPVVDEDNVVTEVVPPEEEQPLPEDLDDDPLPDEEAVLPEVVVPEEIEVPVPPSGDE